MPEIGLLCWLAHRRCCYSPQDWFTKQHVIPACLRGHTTKAIGPALNEAYLARSCDASDCFQRGGGHFCPTLSRQNLGLLNAREFSQTPKTAFWSNNPCCIACETNFQCPLFPYQCKDNLNGKRNTYGGSLEGPSCCGMQKVDLQGQLLLSHFRLAREGSREPEPTHSGSSEVEN